MDPTLPSATADVPLEELKHLRFLSRAVDDLLEESLKARENLEQTFRRAFPQLLTLAGAKGVVVTTSNEELTEETWWHGDFGETFPGTLLAQQPWGVRKVGADTLVSQALDVVGQKVGSMALLFAGDHSKPPASQRLVRALETIAEEFDTVLATVQTASEKHQLIVRINHLLSNRVFETGMDQAVQALSERVKLPGFMLLYRDAVESGALHYRIYRFGRLEHESGEQPFPPMEEAIRAFGDRLISPNDENLRKVLSSQKVVEAVLISGVSSATTLGKILVWSQAEGFSAYTMDLIRVLSATLSQRLIDYNRERIHLSQFFSAMVIDELLQDPDYGQRYLTPRDAEVGILFADINGFTRICEQVLEKPEKIGQFVDDWSQEVVNILWRHGGVFDKMVGDCVIGLFGPPFFRDSRTSRAESAVRAAIEIQGFTRDKMSSHPEVTRISELIQLPGLGVAIGVNLASTFCGLFGPNKQYTGFSTGMNQTARLQSLGAFRETLVMESVRKALETSDDPQLRSLAYGPLTETPVKNVAHPLRHFKLLWSAPSAEG
ncbi:MAG: adenylate/guanylate cyclase domain-containing protein [Myxococcales bacterium]|nr:adenylate/guanylate cyclase domain-containing protein [Myxococcales bacterium]